MSSDNPANKYWTLAQIYEALDAYIARETNPATQTGDSLTLDAVDEKRGVLIENIGTTTRRRPLTKLTSLRQSFEGELTDANFMKMARVLIDQALIDGLKVDRRVLLTDISIVRRDLVSDHVTIEFVWALYQ